MSIVRNKIFITSNKQDTSSLQFVKDLFKQSKTPFPEKPVEERLKETKGDVTGVCIPYKLDTKYYTANVDIWLDEIEKQETMMAYSENEEVAKSIDAFVFIYHEDGLKSINWWLPFLEVSEPGIRICIGYDQATEEMNDWCLSNGFDYVDMNEEKTGTPMDKVGIELALDILQTNMWDGMIRKSNNNITEEEEELDLIREIQELQLHKEEKEDYDELDLPSQSEINEMREKLFGSLDGEEDDLDNTFQMLQSMREHGKTLSDQERRKMAAQVALSFAAQLGI
ncbi:hypothetical protein G6F37_001071 [Rhizopus arrhizus]|nr:hypothetical protein G6F38_001234 [Rhizopus arrhizus]KAG1163594.1 hypothetical protein G6F37_001071 [Rhizopus arrhizus]